TPQQYIPTTTSTSHLTPLDFLIYLVGRYLLNMSTNVLLTNTLLAAGINLLNWCKVVTTEDIQLGRSELASRDATLKEDIHLTIGTTLWLRKTEEDPDDAKEARASPEESGLG